MPGSQQHFLPQFHQRRFGIEPRNKKTRLWRLDKATGKPETVRPKDEAVIENYYNVELEDGTVLDHADQVLTRFESDAAPVIESIVSDRTWRPNPPDILALLLYLVTLKTRTPRAREALRETDRVMNGMLSEAMVSDRARWRKALGDSYDSEEELEEARLQTLEELRSNKIIIDGGPAREVLMMVVSIEETARTLFEQIGVMCFRLPEDERDCLVASDNPVAHYDPTPKSPQAGVSYMSSPDSITQLAIDPRVALIFHQGEAGRWQEVEMDRGELEEANLLTYAWANEAIYGPSQHAVTNVRRQAKRNRSMLHQFRYKPPRIWVSRGEKPADGRVAEFTSIYKGQTTTQKFYVAPGAEDSTAWPPDDAAPR
jgi:hypothetical protein